MRAAAPRRPPNRSCVACRAVRQKRELLRVVRTPSGDVELDWTGRAAGRGAYVCRDAECIDQAIKKGALNRTLKTPIPTELRTALLARVAEPTPMTIEGGAVGQE